ncbi:hypothetical protein ACFHWD_03225 [Clostridium sp. MT-14]|uniref:hypothetical protein n=1 Tax=Clostridium sp. MT-14 TaxID=3348360 RepID=UPI0035F32171
MTILNFILGLYIKISIFTFILFIISSSLTKIGFGEVDVFKSFNEVNKQLEEMNDEKIKNFCNNMLNSCINNPMNILMYELVFAFTPIVHIFFLIYEIKDIINKLTYRKGD